MSRTEAIIKPRVLEIPTSATPSGLLVAEAAIPNHDGNGSTAGIGRFGNFKPTHEGLFVPERKRTGPFDFVVMTDFGGNSTKTDLANGEVELNLRTLAKRRGVEVGSVTQAPLEGFSTINTGFATAQLALHKDHGELDRVFYVNTNPRFDPEDKRSWVDEDNFGRFVYVKLDNGSKIFTVNSKYALSFVKDHVKEAWVLKTDRNDQFLSRYQFIKPTMAVLSGDKSYFDKPLDIDTIPDVPEGDLVAQDGNGNLKTSWQVGHLLEQPGIADSPSLEVIIDGKPYFARNNLVEKGGITGDLVVQGGSSGYNDTRPPTREQLAEVVVLYNSAAKLYGIRVVNDNTRVDIRASNREVTNVA